MRPFGVGEEAHERISALGSQVLALYGLSVSTGAEGAEVMRTYLRAQELLERDEAAALAEAERGIRLAEGLPSGGRKEGAA